MKKLIVAILLVALFTPCVLAEATPEASLEEKLTAMAQVLIPSLLASQNMDELTPYGITSPRVFSSRCRPC